MSKKRLLVIGGGAAGFFCAVNAARLFPELDVLIAEKSDKLLSKVRISGGGRCNVTHACFSIADMLRNYPRGAGLLKKAFHQFFTTDTIRWFEERGVPLKTEADGRMFPVSDSSASVVDCLMNEARRYRVQLLLRHEVDTIRVLPLTDAAAGFETHFVNGNTVASDFICIASGGYPKELQYQWIARKGICIETPVPSLFTFNMPGNPIRELMGVAVENVMVKIAGTRLSATGPVLVTHWGMSGPAVLKLSALAARELSACRYQFRILVNWLPVYNENTMLAALQSVRFEKAPQKISNRNPFGLPGRLWEFLLLQTGIPADMRWADLPAAQQNKLVKILCGHELVVSGKTGFKEEFVTAGGISLSEADPQTMESRKIPGLFFAGEVLDVDGVTGGFNFQNAWTTGWIAAMGVGRKMAQGEAAF